MGRESQRAETRHRSQRAEYDAAFAEKITVSGGFQPELYNRLADAEKIILDGDHDVFGDGRVRIVSAPGTR